jgi:hypothetical protein
MQVDMTEALEINSKGGIAPDGMMGRKTAYGAFAWICKAFTGRISGKGATR